MKKILFLISMFLLLNVNSFSQGLSIFVHSGYTFGDRFPVYGGTGKIYDGHTYGGAINYEISDFYAIEISYSRQDSRVTAVSSSLLQAIDEPLSSNYILGGVNRQLKVSDEATLYGGLKLGAVIYSTSGSRFDAVTRFAVGLNAGAKYMFAEKIGLRIQANLNSPVTDIGSSLWWSPGSGVNVGVSSYTPILQFGFTGGLVFQL